MRRSDESQAKNLPGQLPKMGIDFASGQRIRNIRAAVRTLFRFQFGIEFFPGVDDQIGQFDAIAF